MTHTGQSGIYFDSDGYKLLGTLFLAEGDSPKPTALILHGLPGIEKNYDIALALREIGWNSVIFHYRGRWGSAGNYILKTIPKDIKAAINYLTSGAHPQIDPHRIITIGHSLGGWAAVLGAANDQRVRGVVVYCAVTDPHILHFGQDIVATDFTPWLHGISPEEFVAQWRELGDEFSPVQQASKIAPRPLLIIHAEKDSVVPVSQAYALYDCAHEPRTLFIHDEANHSFTWHREWLREKIVQWLNQFIW